MWSVCLLLTRWISTAPFTNGPQGLSQTLSDTKEPFLHNSFTPQIVLDNAAVENTLTSLWSYFLIMVTLSF